MASERATALIVGSCLCGAVGFVCDGPATPIELCHCPRCRKAYGSAFAATFYVRATGFRWTRGESHVATYTAPVRDRPPGYRHVFCALCGSALPIVDRAGGYAEIPAGAVDGDPGVRPMRHIFVERKAPWYEITDPLPTYPEHVPSSEHLVMRMLGRIHHIDVTVADLGRSTEFYDRVLPLLGFRRLPDTEGNPVWAGAYAEIGLQPGRTSSGLSHDRYAPGLHHLAFAAPDRGAVDQLHRDLVGLGVRILDPPAQYDRYAPGYYAVFFADPDGIKLEYVFTTAWPV